MVLFNREEKQLASHAVWRIIISQMAYILEGLRSY
jgi:hypothetical protein